MKKKIAARLRRIAGRLHPITYKNTWTGDTFTGTEGYDQACLVLETDGHATGTTLKINGKPVHNCTGVTFSIKVGDVARATVELEDVAIRFAGKLEQDGAPDPHS